MTISNIKLVVGLGNRGLNYSKTRHNIGYRVIDNLIKEYGVISSETYCNSIYRGPLYIGKKQLVALLKPSIGGMNDSGLSVRNTMEEMCLQPSQVLIIHDDINLPFGTIRLREGGSAGGHNGVKSIIKELQTEEFIRFKIGIGQPVNSTILDWVLSNFTEFEQNQLSNIINFSSDVITNILQGVITQGDTFNL